MKFAWTPKVFAHATARGEKPCHDGAQVAISDERGSGRFSRPVMLGVAAAALLQGCAAFPRLAASPVGADTMPTRQRTEAEPTRDRRSNVELLESAPAGGAAQAPVRSATPLDIEAIIPDRPVEVTFPPQPLPQFIDTVFGQVLQTPYVMGPGVAERRDIVAVRGPVVMSSRQLFSITQATLEQYGLALVYERGAVRIVQDSVLSGQSPVFIRTRTMPDTPNYSRAVVQFFALSALDVDTVMGLLDHVYPNRGSVRFTAQPATNTLMISGSARDVASAAAIISEIDRPRFAGGQVARVEPTYMSAEQLADALTRTLTTEGYRISTGANDGTPSALALLPAPNANQLLIFSSQPDLFERALYWIGELDRASALGDRDGVFIYTVQNTSAEDLGALIAQLQNDAATPPGMVRPEDAVRRVDGERVGRFTGAAGAPQTIGAFTIDPVGNRILFRGSPSDFEHARDLLERLDTPPPQVLVEITVAEVTLTDETRFGVEWFLDQTITDGTLSASTLGGSTRQGGGLGIELTHSFSRGTVEAALNAFASNRNLNILSTPRVVARSGSEAEIMIGTDVPIITSQRAADNQSNGDTDILQTVQYRQTGVILNVRPVVYGDRIDIQLYQEVSNQEPNTTSDIASPLISNRSVTTQLSLQEGMTAVIGGMMQDNYSREQRGVPGLKDLPFIGAAFRTDGVSGNKIELVILVTPYIIRDADDMNEFSQFYSDSVNRQLRRRGPQVYTLYPWQVPFGGVRTHQGPQRTQEVVVPPLPVPDAPPEAQSVAPAEAEPAPQAPSGPSDIAPPSQTPPPG
ncbi:MAG: secretin N-terminal domain-containing protein [Hyphomonadaceae bacterium]